MQRCHLAWYIDNCNSEKIISCWIVEIVESYALMYFLWSHFPLTNKITHSRNINIGLILIIATFSTLEYFNCLMFIQESMPYNQYCIIMCLVPYIVNCITEIQFIAYMQLLGNRLKLINNFLSHFRTSTNFNTEKRPMGNFNILPWQGANEIFTVKELRDKIKFPSSSGKAQKNANELHGFVVNVIENRKIVGKHWTDNLQLNNKLFTEKIMKLQIIYKNMEKFLMLIRSAYSVQIITIFTVKFSIITSMLYACCMILIKYEKLFIYLFRQGFILTKKKIVEVFLKLQKIIIFSSDLSKHVFVHYIGFTEQNALK